MTGLAKRVDLKNLGKTRKLYQKQRDRRFKQGLKAATPHSPNFCSPSRDLSLPNHSLNLFKIQFLFIALIRAFI